MNVVQLIEASPELGEVVVPEVSGTYMRLQPAGLRKFVVTGPKADAIRLLIFANLGLTRKQIAAHSGASVSRVGEVVWGLEQDAIEFPKIPLR